MAVLAGLSTFDPALTLSIGPAVAVVVLILGRPLAFKMDAPVLLAALFALWAWVSISWAPAQDFTHATAVLWSQVLVIFIAAYDLIKSRAQLRLLAAGFVAGAVFTVAKNLYFGPDVAETVATGGRAVLGNANVNYVAYALTTALALVVLLWVTRTRTKTSFLILGAASTVLIAGLVVSDTRAAHVGAACLLAWVVVCAVTRRRPIKLLVAVVIVSALCIMTGVADEASLAYESGARVTGDWSGRLVIWPLAREMWAENPIFGVGAGAFVVTSGLGVGAHNVILQTGTGLGVVGVGLLVALIWTALAGKRGNRHAGLAGAFLAAAAPMYLSGMWETAPAAWIAIAVFARLGVLTQDVPKQEPASGRPERTNVPDWMKTSAQPTW
jgi:O-antigen ligase